MARQPEWLMLYGEQAPADLPKNILEVSGMSPNSCHVYIRALHLWGRYPAGQRTIRW